ncbi:hypothetical protein [Klebsiella oxytoca]|uniref:hypothetical protein n=1 Tax=Klebsiella oxytoca TaxID=571 RepID=UPI001DCA40CD|nr:hypothetical protein [Klebsiella oxytoca]CAF2854652.1 hypothetical protein AI2945V1_1617 [Klebsiella oxytoca]CAF2865757.1 hypothetical protein AI2946V1_1616 [Klebsiella oxytoca]CAH5525910.1 hypothetical protein AI2946V1_1616 [Klebsiella oxytoca]CAH5600750.1 hypothetical protein AI2945V1_1617 [Klebsiella oxytoca]
MKLTEGQLLFRLQDFHGAEQEALGIGDYEFAQESADIANALRELLQARRTIEELTAVVEQRNGECVRLHSELESRTVKMPEPFKLAKSSSGLTYYFADDVDAALTAAGIKWEVE